MPTVKGGKGMLLKIPRKVKGTSGAYYLNEGKEFTAPVPDDTEVKMQKMIEYQRKYGKAGRAGTIMTGGGSKLG